MDCRVLQINLVRRFQFIKPIGRNQLSSIVLWNSFLSRQWFWDTCWGKTIDWWFIRSHYSFGRVLSVVLFKSHSILKPVF